MHGVVTDVSGAASPVRASQSGTDGNGPDTTTASSRHDPPLTLAPDVRACKIGTCRANQVPYSLCGLVFVTAQNIGAQSTVIEYPLATGVLPQGIAPGADGNLWIAESYGNKIAKVTTAGCVIEYPLPTAQSVPANIILGS